MEKLVCGFGAGVAVWVWGAVGEGAGTHNTAFYLPTFIYWSATVQSNSHDVHQLLYFE